MQRTWQLALPDKTENEEAMTLQELYDSIGGDYEDAVGRLFSEDMIGKFVVMFLDDTSCPELIAAWEAGDDQAAFEAAHKAKGVCGNLSLARLARLSTDICEALRPGNDELRAATDVGALVAQLEDAYRAAIDAINAYAGH